MKFINKSKFLIQQEQEHILVPYFEETDIKSQLQQVLLERDTWVGLVKKSKAKEQQTYVIPFQSGSLVITLLPLGYEKEFNLNKLREQFQIFGKAVKEDYQILLEGLFFAKYQLCQVVETIIQAMYVGAYSFEKDNLSLATTNRIFAIRDMLKYEKASYTMQFIHSEDLQKDIDKAMAYGQCINHARVLGDIPNNYLHVKQFSEYIIDLANHYNLPWEVLGKSKLEEYQCGGILGVNAGCEEEPNLIVVYYEGCKGDPVTALIGKGVMFDSGGYHLKSISGMEGMKYDMCGAANMLAALELVVRQNSKKNILLIIPAVENLMGPSSCKMGDVLTTMSGKTVEVYNTDAEGRLILSDAITYAIEKGVHRIIDLATLTYSCHSALGDEISGVFSNNEEFYETFRSKALEQGEWIWRMPLESSYHKPLYGTQAADLINYAPGSGGGASIAACFLEEFVEPETPWIHIDFVGPSVKRKEDHRQSAGATGAFVASVAALFE